MEIGNWRKWNTAFFQTLDEMFKQHGDKKKLRNMIRYKYSDIQKTARSLTKYMSMLGTISMCKIKKP